jgi:hypothetical protein
LEESGMSFAVFALPLPVGVDNLWRPVARGRHLELVKTSAYKSWLSKAGCCVDRQKQPAIKGSYALTIRVSTAARVDLGDAERACVDLLQAHGVIENDRLAQKITLEWASPDELEGGGLHVLVVASEERAHAA